MAKEEVSGEKEGVFINSVHIRIQYFSSTPSNHFNIQQYFDVNFYSAAVKPINWFDMKQ